MLAQTGVLARIGVWTDDAFRQMAEQVLNQFQNYKAAHPNAARPKPEGPCTVCPDCGGSGLHVKKVLNVQLGNVCKTCGGSGYVPKP